MRYPFIAFEGGDGSGKTTQSKLLVERLNADSIPTIWTREAGGTPLGAKIRELLLSSDFEKMSAKTEALLFAADRAEHVDKLVSKKLSEAIVVTDRYIDSSGAYQSSGRGLGWSEIKKLNRWATDALTPDLTFIVDVPVEMALKRIPARANADRFEKEQLKFHLSVREFMLKRYLKNKDRYRLIDGSKTPEEISEDVWNEFSKWIKNTSWSQFLLK